MGPPILTIIVNQIIVISRCIIIPNGRAVGKRAKENITDV